MSTPNFIYINPDQLRASAIGCYGHPLASTPNMDRLAAAGVRFDNCYVQHTVCTPSRCSFMTGWYPHVRGHRTLWHLLRADEPNTLKYLKQDGYDVYWAGKNDLLTEEAFDESVSEIHGWRGDLCCPERIYEPGDPEFYTFLMGPHSDEGHVDRQNYDAAKRFLRGREPDSAPFMLYLPTSKPHAPFTCPEPFYSMYDPNDLPPLRPAELPNKPCFYRLIRQYRGLDVLDENVLRQVMAVYLGMVSYFDSLLGELLDTLEESGLVDNTVIVLFSDHGEWAGDYGVVEKWHSALDDCLTRVPLIIRAPGCATNHVVTAPVECFDIVPTTLELAGVECQHTHFARSLIPQLQGHAGDHDRAVFAEGGYDTHEPHCYEGSRDIGDNPKSLYYPKGRQQQEHPESSVRATMIRTDTHKLIYRPQGVSELYDMVEDPDELDNRYDDAELAELRQTLEKRLLNWYVHTSDVTPHDRDPRGAFPRHLVVGQESGSWQK